MPRDVRTISGLAVAAAAVIVFGGSAALAGECPADQVVAAGTGPTSGPTEPERVTDTVLARVDLAGWIGGVAERKLVIQPGGIVPRQDLGDGPALIRVTDGEMVEDRSTCRVPITHKPGEVSVEARDVMHWRTNETDKVAVLSSSDILYEQADAHVM